MFISRTKKKTKNKVSSFNNKHNKSANTNANFNNYLHMYAHTISICVHLLPGYTLCSLRKFSFWYQWTQLVVSQWLVHVWQRRATDVSNGCEKLWTSALQWSSPILLFHLFMYVFLCMRISSESSSQNRYMCMALYICMLNRILPRQVSTHFAFIYHLLIKSITYLVITFNFFPYLHILYMYVKHINIFSIIRIA